MKYLRTDVAILGAGFSGSLLALMLSRHREVVLLERGRHPRFALGESSTPLADLALQEIAREYELPWLAPLAKYGSWKRAYPELPVGLKRGFTFAKHEAGAPFAPDPEHANELLVTASPNDETADTQWLRADFDHFIVGKVVEAGIPYFDRTELDRVEHGTRWRLSGKRQGEEVTVEANLVVDASGPGGALRRALDLPAGTLETESHAVFSHFEGVERWEDVVAGLGGRVADYPYHADDAALHHVFDDGWMYVLRFESGLVSAGFLLGGSPEPPDASPARQWEGLLRRYPSVAHQFRRARPVRPIDRSQRLQRYLPQCAGEDWAMLAPAAYTMDALFSTGNAHALMTVQRLARILIERRGREAGPLLNDYAPALREEVAFIDRLVSTAYGVMSCFPLFVAWSMYYFAGAIAGEERRRQGRGEPGDRFLSSHLPWFRAAVEASSRSLGEVARQDTISPEAIEAFERRVAEDVAPINTTGLCQKGKRNLYPY